MNFRRLLPTLFILLLLGNSCKKKSPQILPSLPGSWTAMPSPRMGQLISTSTGLIAIGDSVYFSTDHASTWTVISNIPAISSICLDLQNNSRLVACSDSELYVSTNGGRSWTVLNQILTRDSIYLFAVSGSRLFAVRPAHFSGALTNVLLRSDDMGTTWDTTYDYKPLWSNQLLLRNNALYLFTSDMVLKSTDNGSSWITQNASSPVYIYIGTTSNGNIIGAGSSANIYQSKDSCRSWQQIFDHDVAPTASVVLGSTLLFNTVLYEDAYLVCGNPDKKVWYNASSGLGNGTSSADSEYVYLIPSIQSPPTMIYRRPLSDFSGL